MKQDLPKSVPPAVLAAAENAMTRTDEIIRRRKRAEALYRSDAYRRFAQERRSHVMYDDLIGKAQAIVDWGDNLRKSLPDVGRLIDRFRTRDEECPTLSVVHHEMGFTERDGLPAMRLTNRLDLVMEADVGLFRHYVSLDGFRMTGGGLLNTPTSLFHSIDPDALKQIHRLIADGQNWRHIEASFSRLVDDFKDR